MKNPKIYIESSVISVQTARPSKNVLLLARQQYTNDWWDSIDQYTPYISQAVLDEIKRGDVSAAEKRLRLVESIPLLPYVDEVNRIVGCLLREKALPFKAWEDAHHIAIAAVHDVDYLLTWNMTHIANPFKRQHVIDIIRQFRTSSPMIITPQELLEASQ